jgi:hypothetical protein
MIDFAFIGELEGRRLQGYVPEGGHSGVTIATGCDLGWLTEHALARMPDLCSVRFAPYHGRIGADAREYLAAHPLAISSADANRVDQVTFDDDITAIAQAFRCAAHTSFISLPDRAQTVIASVGFQYGNLARKCPHFWARAVARDYTGMVATLRDFGDAYPTRRHKEADYLAVLFTPAGV